MWQCDQRLDFIACPSTLQHIKTHILQLLILLTSLIIYGYDERKGGSILARLILKSCLDILQHIITKFRLSVSFSDANGAISHDLSLEIVNPLTFIFKTLRQDKAGFCHEAKSYKCN